MKIKNLNLRQLRTWCLTALVFWSLLMNGSLCLFIGNEWKSLRFIGREIGLAAIHKDSVYQIWNAHFGGVYTHVSAENPPNPFLSTLAVQTVITQEGKELTLINPAHMTRQVYEFEQKLYDIRGRIVSLKPIHPNNSPDEWERAALLQFEEGVEDVVELTNQDDKTFVRVMAPIIVQQSCLKCHAEQGYKAGDIRGGVSITLPMERIVVLLRQHFQSSVFYHLLIYLIGLTGLGIFYFQTSRQLIKRAMMEEQLSSQEQYLRGIVDNISNGIAVYEAFADGKEFRLKSINPSGLRIAKIHPDQALGKRAEEIFPEYIESGLLQVFHRVFRTGQAEYLSVTTCTDAEQSTAPKKAAEPPCLEYYVYKLPSEEIVSVYEDVTSRKKAREQLLRKTAEWENTFDAIPDIITLQDKNMRIIRANQATFEFFRMSPDKLLGSTCHSLFRNSDTPCPGCPGLRAMKDFHKHCNNIEHKTLSKFFHICAAPVLNSESEFLYFVYIAHDITEKKKLEDELFHAQKMEAIGTLAGGIAHDFNNILAAILGYTELARMELPQECHARSDLDQVIIAGNRATDLVKQILTFSRKNEHRKKPLRISLIVKEAVKMIRSSLPSSIDIQVDINQDVGLVLADPTNIHQIVLNLCTNASHAIGSKQGRMEIILRQVKLSTAQVADKHGILPGYFVVLTVKDSGAGMDEKTLSRIFDPYFTTKEQGAGTGLGLAVTHGVVEDCHGFVEVESELGKGSAFHVYLPVLLEENHANEKEEPAQLAFGNERILFVDDEPSIVHISLSILTGLGYSVVAETNSLDALEKFYKDPNHFDLVITDQTMPGLTGSELAKAMLAVRPDLPIILCTGYTSVISEQEALYLGIRRYVVKPLNTFRISSLVREVLDEEFLNKEG
jgi:PAS domain S-box-containing protein